jgi:hypothetical protein
MRAAAIARMLDWARAGGAWWNGIEFVVDVDGHASAIATRGIPAGESILRLPRSLMIVDDELGFSERTPEDSLAAWLARREPGRWRAYVDTLPAELPDLPLFHDHDDLEVLAGTAASSIVDAVNLDVYEGYECLRARDVPEDDFTWGRAIVLTRGFHAPGTLEHRLALIPLVDILNHRPGDTTWTFDGAMTVATERAFERGEQVCFSYGDQRSDSYLFVHYGFTLADNPANEAELVLGDVRVRLGCIADRRLAEALELGNETAIAAAARCAIAQLDAYAVPASPRAWDRKCAIVRAGERAVLEKLTDVDYVRSLAREISS